MTPQEMMQRIEGLERRQRRYARAGLVAMSAAAGLLAIGAGKPLGGKVVEAEKLLIRDSKGSVRAEIGTTTEGWATIELLDGKGAKVMSLRGPTSAPIIELADGAGGSIWLTSSTTGSSMSLSKGNGELEIMTNASGAPSMRIQNKDGKVVWQAP